MKKTTLAEVLNYRNEQVVRRFSQKLKVSLSDANCIFSETLKWLWLCQEHKSDLAAGASHLPPLTMLRTNAAIEEMWQIFILFTSDYEKFCNTHFGSFLHYYSQQDLTGEVLLNASFTAEIEQIMAYAQDELYNYVCNKLGNETAALWFKQSIAGRARPSQGTRQSNSVGVNPTRQPHVPNAQNFGRAYYTCTRRVMNY